MRRAGVLAALAALALCACGRRAVNVSDSAHRPTRWALTAGGPGFDSAEAVSSSPAGGICLGGAFSGQASFGSQTLLAAGGTDAFVARLDAAGATLWARAGGGSRGDDSGSAVAAHGDGGCHLAGRFLGPARFGSLSLDSPAHGGLFVARLDSQGQYRWVTAINSDGQLPELGALATDSRGNSFITGALRSTTRIGSLTLQPAGPRDAFVAALTEDGAPRWAVAIGGADSEARGTGVALDSAGQAYVTGSFSGTLHPGSLTLTSPGRHDNDLFVTRLGPGGRFDWAVTLGDSGQEYAGAITHHPTSGLLLTAAFSGTTRIGQVTLRSTSERGQELVARLQAADGRVVWAVPTLSPPPLGRSPITTTPGGRPALASSFMGWARLGGFPLTPLGNSTPLVTELDTSGRLLRATTTGSVAATTTAHDLATDPGDNIYVVGSLRGKLTLGQGTLVADSEQVLIWKLGPAGR